MVTNTIKILQQAVDPIHAFKMKSFRKKFIKNIETVTNLGVTPTNIVLSVPMIKSLLLTLPLLFITECFATSTNVVGNQLPPWALGPFTRPSGINPILEPVETSFDCPMRKEPVKWESSDTFNPAAIVKDGKVYVLYRAEDKSGIGIGKRTSRVGLAMSDDGLHFTRRSEPVLFPDEDDQKDNEWAGGCEDPRIVERNDGIYALTYTQWNRKIARLAVATSKDLVHWTKHGPAFAKAYGGRFVNKICKSGSIVTKLSGDRLVAAKVDGKYLMISGESPAMLSTSEDAIAWKPVLDERGEIVVAFAPKNDTFFSSLTEPGPPALLTDQGILLLYNGKNRNGNGGDPRFKSGVYSAGQVLFDLKNPSKALDWLTEPFFSPKMPYEVTGQYSAGTVFIEGLVYFQKKWFLYYGCADSKVSVAVWDPNHACSNDPIPE